MKLLVLFSTLTWLSSTHSQPSNDECIGATTIPSIVAVPFIDTVLNVQSATANLATDPLTTCIFEPFPTIWYDWEPTSNAVVDITAIGRDLENDFTIFPRGVSIFKGDACDNLQEVVCAADTPIIQSFNVTAGQKYFIVVLVDAFISSNSSMTFEIENVPLPPPNDECVDALIIPSDVAFPYSTQVVSPRSATENPSDPVSSCLTASSFPTSAPLATSPPIAIVFESVWYTWIPLISGLYDFSAKSTIFEFDIPFDIEIYEGGTCGSVEEIACSATGSGIIRGVNLNAETKYYIKASSEFGNFVDELILTVKPVPPPPPNDECVDAIIIPSDVAFPYSTQSVNPRSATENPSDPVSSCLTPTSFPTSAPFIRLSSFPTSAPFIGSTSFPTSAPFITQPPIARVFESVWYSWVPSITGLYDFSTQLSNLGFDFLSLIEIYEGSSCVSLVEEACGDGLSVGTIRRVELNAGTQYFIKVVIGNIDEELTLTVKESPPSPPNDECINAISVDPLAGEILIGNTTDASLDKFSFRVCGARISAPGIWYKVDNVSPTPLPIDVNTCSEETTYDTEISVFSGTCDSLQCVGGNDDACGLSSKFSFVASPLTTYYILVHGFGSGTGAFALTIDGSLNYFSLIDSKTDEIIQRIGNADVVNYSFLPSSTLNIQASFENAQSARLTFDNPRRSNCERQAPFAVFGDKNGDYFNATIPIGSHTVTATPYTGVDCKGTAGATLSKTFEVEGCFFDFILHDFTTNSTEFLFGNPTIPACNINLEARLFCGFDIGFVRFQLRSAATNKIVFSKRENRPPYFMFSNQGEVVNAGSIEPGDYTIEINIDGINHEAFEISAVDNGSCN